MIFYLIKKGKKNPQMSFLNQVKWHLFWFLIKQILYAMQKLEKQENVSKIQMREGKIIVNEVF